MQTTTLFRRAALSLAFSAALFAGDVSGKWVAKMETPNGSVEQTYILKANGDKLTGSVKSARGESEIQDGRVSGYEVSFVVVRNFNGNEFKMNYSGKLDGDSLKLKIQMGERGEREVTAKRGE
ncbi:MAG: hypothetical protein R2729_02970 [Bryobacteraceae bacterium]